MSYQMPLFHSVTMLVVVILTIVIVLVCCILKYCLYKFNSQHPLVIGEEKRLQHNDKLKDKFMRQFKNSIRKFKKSRPDLSDIVHDESQSQSCAICFEDYVESPQTVFLGYIKLCNHFYHFKCIWQWLERNEHCPLCRETVKLTEKNIVGISLKNLPTHLNEQMPEKQQVHEKSSSGAKDNGVKPVHMPHSSVGTTTSTENNFNTHEPVEPHKLSKCAFSDE